MIAFALRRSDFPFFFTATTMSTDWISFLNTQGLAPDGADFGVLGNELRAAVDRSVVAPLTDFGVIRASGADAADFLHNLMTNDVNGIDGQVARFAGFCTPKGRLLASFLIWREGDDLLLMVARDIHAMMLKKLSMYVLRAKVKLTDASAEIALLGFKAAPSAGPPAPTFSAAAGEMPIHGAIDVDGGKAIRLDATRWLLAIHADRAIQAWPTLAAAATPVGTSTWQWLDINAGQPRVIAATQEAFVPQMLNMEHAAVAGVSFTKGCYPGQEIVARTQYLGKVKRRMFRARLPAAFAPGVHVFAPETADQHCGALVSVAPAPDGAYEALVCVQSGAVEAGEVHLGSLDGPRLEFLDLPYTVA
jgi:folate-binding protein YgfZ